MYYYIGAPPFLGAEVLHRRKKVRCLTPTVNDLKSAFTVGVRRLRFYLRCNLFRGKCINICILRRDLRYKWAVFFEHFMHISVPQMHKYSINMLNMLNLAYFKGIYLKIRQKYLLILEELLSLLTGFLSKIIIFYAYFRNMQKYENYA